MFKMKKLGAVAASLAFAGALALTSCAATPTPRGFRRRQRRRLGSDTMQLVTDGTLDR